MLRTLRRYSQAVYRTYDGTAASLGQTDQAAAAAAMASYPTVELASDVHRPPLAARGGDASASGSRPASAYVPPLLVLHGLFGSRANSRSVAKQLAKRLGTDVHCLDLRNHGASPHMEPHTYPALAGDVEAYVRTRLAPGVRPLVVGHSMGAKTAMAVALRGKVPIAGLVAVDNAPVVGGGRCGFAKFGRYVEALQRAEGCTSLRECDAVLSRVEPSTPVRQFLLTNMRADAARGGRYFSRVPLATLGRALDHIADWPYASCDARYGGPALFVRGTRSPYVPDDVLPAVGHFFPQFTVEDVDAGHWVIAEQPAEFVRVVERWVGAREWEQEQEGEASG